MAIEKITPIRPNILSLVILFSNSDFKGINQNLHDLVISMIADNYIIRKVLVDHGSSTNILYYSILQKM